MNLIDLCPLESSRLVIRPVCEADLSDLLEINSDPQVTAFLPYATWNSRDDGVAWLGRMGKLAAAGTGQQFVLQAKQDAKVVGTLLVFRLEAGSRRAEVGYVLGRQYWGRGLMTEALEAVCARCFGLGLRRLEAEVEPSNAASNALLGRLGFVKEGVLRKRWETKGRTYDTNIYGLLAQDRQS